MPSSREIVDSVECHLPRCQIAFVLNGAQYLTHHLHVSFHFDAPQQFRRDRKRLTLAGNVNESGFHSWPH